MGHGSDGRPVGIESGGMVIGAGGGGMSAQDLGFGDAGVPARSPIRMLLWCPCCGERHIDRGEFASKPHHTHACQSCGVVWRPAIEDTVGVQFLPGFKDS